MPPFRAKEAIESLRDAYEQIRQHCASSESAASGVSSCACGSPVGVAHALGIAGLPSEHRRIVWDDIAASLPRAELEAHFSALLTATENVVASLTPSRTSPRATPPPQGSVVVAQPIPPPPGMPKIFSTASLNASATLGICDSYDDPGMYGSASVRPKYHYREYHRLEKKEDYDGNKVINDFTIVGELGRGSYGKVKLAAYKNRPTQLVAIKIINRSLLRDFREATPISSEPTSMSGKPISNLAQERFLAVRREIAVMKKLHHRNVVGLRAVIDDSESQKLYLVMDYIPNGPIVRYTDEAHRHCNPLDEGTIRGYLRQIIDGLRYLHKHNIVHRDVKPDNILLGERNRIYLADFGVSQILSNQKGHAECKGTPAFWPPELFAETLDPNLPPEAHDVWSLGVSVYMMLTGTVPFPGESIIELAEQTRNMKELTWPSTPKVSAQAMSLVGAMLQKDVSRRITLLGLREHPFFNFGSATGEKMSWDEMPIDRVTVDDEEEQAAIAEAHNVVPSLQRRVLLRARPQVSKFAEQLRERVRANNAAVVSLNTSQRKPSIEDGPEQEQGPEDIMEAEDTSMKTLPPGSPHISKQHVTFAPQCSSKGDVTHSPESSDPTVSSQREAQHDDEAGEFRVSPRQPGHLIHHDLRPA